MNFVMVPMAIISLGYILMISFKFEAAVRERLWAATLLIILSVVFWGFYEQSGGSLNLMAERNVDMKVGTTILPSAMVNNSINPFYIIFLTPIFAVMWDVLAKYKIEPNTPMKFGIAFLLLAGGYLIFVMGGTVAGTTGLMPMIYFMLGYLLITSGELFLSPIGLSMVTKLAPM